VNRWPIGPLANFVRLRRRVGGRGGGAVPGPADRPPTGPRARPPGLSQHPEQPGLRLPEEGGTVPQADQETYLRAVFSLDPATLAEQVRVPTLIVRGSRDPAITTADSNALAAAIGTPATVLIASGVGHTRAIGQRRRSARRRQPPLASSPVQSVLGAPQLAVTHDTFILSATGNWMAPPAPQPGGLTPPPGGGGDAKPSPPPTFIGF
jgi:pimeloyl-ACP methyl ester carboxylesterase